MTLQPAQVVRHIYRNMTPRFRKLVSAAKFLDILNVAADASAVSRFLGGHSHGPIERALNYVTRQEDLLKALQLTDDDIFQSKTTAELDRRLGVESVEEVERFVSPPIQPVGRFPAALGFCTHERNAILELARALTNDKRNVVTWRASFPLGASFLASSIGYAELIARRYREIYVVRPHAGARRPFDKELKVLARRLDAEASEQQLLEALTNRGALLILLNVEATSRLPKSSRVRKLIELAKRTDGRAYKSAILAVGVSSCPELNEEADEKLRASLEKTLAMEPGPRWPFFLDQWRRFGALRANPRGEEVGSVLKRAHWHYQEVKDRPVWPINIRVRAYFASNLRNHAIFDPTAGFLTLAGQPPEKMPADIVSFENDVRAYMAHWDESYAEGRLRMLRLISTAKYWLSSKMLHKLRDNPVDGDMGYPVIERHMNELAFAAKRIPIMAPGVDSASAAQGADNSVAAITADGASASADGKEDEANKDVPKFTYVAGIGIKAIVQDLWRSEAPYTRALAHYRIAHSLFNAPSTEGALNGEFPFDPHWAGPNIYFASETIRHLVRTIEAVNSRRVTKPLAPFRGKFPDPPSERLNGCNPTQVIDFAFDVLFRQSLNEHRDKPEARALSKRLGAYALAVEMLQLLSEPGKMGKPHWALSPKHHRSFIRECGYALLNVGDIRGAHHCFGDLLGTGSGSSAPEHSLDKISDHLDLSLLHAARNDLGASDDVLHNAAERMPEARRLTAAIDDPAVQRTTQIRLDKLSRRITSRRAYLAYLRGRHSEALSLIDETDGGEGVSDPDILLTRISALTLRGGKGDHDEAMATCLFALLRQSSDGVQHDALGFRIALAGILRSEGRLLPAEKVLDTAHQDVLRNGCSERTFLNFLLEAGKVLNAQERHPRAYASYLRACALRAHSRGLTREMEEAKQLALTALATTLERMREMGPKDWKAEIEVLSAEDRDYNDKDSPKILGAFARDPLYGYSIAEARLTFDDLATEDGILNHIRQIEGLTPPPRRDRSKGKAESGN